MVLIEMHHSSLRAWAILDSRSYTSGELCCVYMPAATDSLHGVMFGHLKLQHRQIKDLTGFAYKVLDREPPIFKNMPALKFWE